jgi:cobalt-zinc-cadmium efflux system outer membrane protein
MEQAELIPNPVLRVTADRVDLDDLGGGPQRYKVAVRERLETAGKREARTTVARERVAQSEEEVRAERFAVALAAARLHQTAVAARRLAAERRTALEAAEAVLALEASRVVAGRRPTSVLPSLRARVGTLRLALLAETERERTALRTLEGLLGAPPEAFSSAAGEPAVDGDLPSATSPEVAASIEARSPEIATLRAMESRVRAEVDHAQRVAWPDVTVGIEIEDGRMSKEQDRDTAAGVFVEVPLPVADRNQGAIRASRAEERRTRTRQAEAAARLRGEYAGRLERIAALRASMRTCREEILPARERDLELARAEEAAGRTDRTRVLELRIARAEAVIVATGHLERIALARLDALAILGREPADW